MKSFLIFTAVSSIFTSLSFNAYAESKCTYQATKLYFNDDGRVCVNNSSLNLLVMPEYQILSPQNALATRLTVTDDTIMRACVSELSMGVAIETLHGTCHNIPEPGRSRLQALYVRVSAEHRIEPVLTEQFRLKSRSPDWNGFARELTRLDRTPASSTSSKIGSSTNSKGLN